MPTESELSKRGFPKKCPAGRCLGFGLYWLQPEVIARGNLKPFPTSKAGAILGWRTVPCPMCGASANPTGKC